MCFQLFTSSLMHSISLLVVKGFAVLKFDKKKAKKQTHKKNTVPNDAVPPKDHYRQVAKGTKILPLHLE